MTEASAGDARALLGAFLRDDAHYRASSGAYGDGGEAARFQIARLDLLGDDLPVDAPVEEAVAVLTESRVEGCLQACVPDQPLELVDRERSALGLGAPRPDARAERGIGRSRKVCDAQVRVGLVLGGDGASPANLDHGGGRG